MCPCQGCEKSFTRSDHLRRHMLNHSIGTSTCTRCRLHFKRPDLLDRHMLRHQKKDEDAGGPGLGVVESRKKMWLDSDGKIVNKRPVAPTACGAPTPTERQAPLQETWSGSEVDRQSVSPSSSTSLQDAESLLQFSQERRGLSFGHDFTSLASVSDAFDPLSNSSWASPSAPVPSLETAGCDYMFHPNTANSLYVPFGATNTHDWLFNLEPSPQSACLMQQDSNVTPIGFSHRQENMIQRTPTQTATAYGTQTPSPTVHSMPDSGCFQTTPPSSIESLLCQDFPLGTQEFSCATALKFWTTPRSWNPAFRIELLAAEAGKRQKADAIVAEDAEVSNTGRHDH